MTTDTGTTDAGTTTDDAENNGAPDELTKQREVNQRLQGKLTDIEKKYNQFVSIYKGIDPDEARATKSKSEELEKKLAKNDPEKMEDIFNRKFSKFQNEAALEKESLGKELAILRAENKTLKVTDKVIAEIGKLFQDDMLKFVKREVEQLCDLDEDGSIVIKDENGDIVYRNGKSLGIKDFGELLVEKYPSMARAQGSGGTKDATPGQRTGRTSNKIPESLAELNSMSNPKEVLAQLRKTNPEAVTKILKTMSTRPV